MTNKKPSNEEVVINMNFTIDISEFIPKIIEVHKDLLELKKKGILTKEELAYISQQNTSRYSSLIKVEQVE